MEESAGEQWTTPPDVGGLMLDEKWPVFPAMWGGMWGRLWPYVGSDAGSTTPVSDPVLGHHHRPHWASTCTS